MQWRSIRARISRMDDALPRLLDCPRRPAHAPNILMSQMSEILDITNLLYTAALSDDGPGGSELAWRSALERMSQTCGGHGSAVLGLTRGRFDFARSVLVGVDTNSADQYCAYYAARDPVLEPALSRSAAGVMLFSEALMPRSELIKSEFYTDWLHSRGWLAGGATTLINAGSSRCVLYFARERRSGSFTTEEMSALAFLVPHAQRAAALAIRLLEHRTVTRLMDTATFAASAPLIIVDRHAVPVYVNRAAKSLLRAADRLSVESPRFGGPGALRGASEANTRRLRALIVTACGTGAQWTSRKSAAATYASGGGSLVVRSSADRAPLVISVAPMPIVAQGARSLFHQLLPAASEPRAILTCADLAPGPAGAAVNGGLHACLCSSFGLTAAEADVAVDISAGSGLASVATQRQVSLATVRTQAAQIYQKTGVRGQVELASFITRLAAHLVQLD